jgi:hypothetical protein
MLVIGCSIEADGDDSAVSSVALLRDRGTLAAMACLRIN